MSGNKKQFEKAEEYYNQNHTSETKRDPTKTPDRRHRKPVADEFVDGIRIISAPSHHDRSVTPFKHARSYSRQPSEPNVRTLSSRRRRIEPSASQINQQYNCF